MLPKTIESYGGPYVDAKVVTNPESQLAASKGNRVFEDVAQLTHTGIRAIVHFPTVGSGDPTVSYHTSVWGSSDAEKPVATRTGAGLYTVTYATDFTDALGVVESVSFLSAQASVISANNDRAVVATIAANVITLKVRNAAGAASDLTPGETVVLWLR